MILNEIMIEEDEDKNNSMHQEKDYVDSWQVEEQDYYL
jgi:hypothetical protein